MPDGQNRPLHFSGKPQPNQMGMAGVYEKLYGAVGKTITAITYGDSPASSTKAGHSEYVVLRFSDGTGLEIDVGINQGDLVALFPDIRAPDVEKRLVVKNLKRED